MGLAVNPPLCPRFLREAAFGLCALLALFGQRAVEPEVRIALPTVKAKPIFYRYVDKVLSVVGHAES